ncbi:glucose-1-phosphate thymidylyltransferase RfbA [Pelagibacteraceae bacterium]|jgi:glucose-1-phosphate thymidylyltransferase|nr:glucose-1-phosphate thymidylyltransferase RfbA [Pelagibacteraceae bacterium]
MIKKGIILAGGLGTRMSPLTKAVNKQLLPIYDKPLIFYPLSVLMLAGIKNILIIVNAGQLPDFRRILPEKNNLGISINYLEQKKPGGLPEAFIIGKEFIGKDNIALILGDNFFYGQSLGKKLEDSVKLKSGARVFLHPVKNPHLYGVATTNNKNKIIKIVEKPKKTKSNLAITGLYFFDNQVINFSKNLKPSKRKELEITDLLNKYRKKNRLTAEMIGRGGTWLDTGNIEDFNNTSNFVSTIENRQGLKIACLEEIALRKNWINKNKVKKAISFYGKCEYSEYLKKIINTKYQ